MRVFLKYWLPVLLWLGVIFVGSTDLMSAEHTSRFIVPILRWLKPDISAETFTQIHFLVRKFGHISEYAILAALIWRALCSGTKVQMKMSILVLVVLLVCAVFAASDEFHQSFVKSRTPSVRDVLLDIVGALIGLLIGRVSHVAALKRPVALLGASSLMHDYDFTDGRSLNGKKRGE